MSPPFGSAPFLFRPNSRRIPEMRFPWKYLCKYLSSFNDSQKAVHEFGIPSCLLLYEFKDRVATSFSNLQTMYVCLSNIYRLNCDWGDARWSFLNPFVNWLSWILSSIMMDTRYRHSERHHGSGESIHADFKWSDLKAINWLRWHDHRRHVLPLDATYQSSFLCEFQTHSCGAWTGT